MVPPVPTPQPAVVVVNFTPERLADEPLVCGDQVAPPVDVCTIVPDEPTAQPFEVSVKETPNKPADVPLVWGDQIAPLSVVFTIVPPPVPTDQPGNWATVGSAETRAPTNDTAANSATRPGRRPERT